MFTRRDGGSIYAQAVVQARKDYGRDARVRAQTRQVEWDAWAHEGTVVANQYVPPPAVTARQRRLAPVLADMASMGRDAFAMGYDAMWEVATEADDPVETETLMLILATPPHGTSEDLAYFNYSRVFLGGGFCRARRFLLYPRPARRVDMEEASPPYL